MKSSKAWCGHSVLHNPQMTPPLSVAICEYLTLPLSSPPPSPSMEVSLSTYIHLDGTCTESWFRCIHVQGHVQMCICMGSLFRYSSDVYTYRVMVQMCTHTESWFRCVYVQSHGSDVYTYRVMVQMCSHTKAWFRCVHVWDHGSDVYMHGVMVQMCTCVGS